MLSNLWWSNPPQLDDRRSHSKVHSLSFIFFYLFLQKTLEKYIENPILFLDRFLLQRFHELHPFWFKIKSQYVSKTMIQKKKKPHHTNKTLWMDKHNTYWPSPSNTFAFGETELSPKPSGQTLLHKQAISNGTITTYTDRVDHLLTTESLIDRVDHHQLAIETCHSLVHR